MVARKFMSINRIAKVKHLNYIFPYKLCSITVSTSMVAILDFNLLKKNILVATVGNGKIYFCPT
jgi:hypothetical protein